ncbi:OmpA family protein [Hypericibacter sp.]|uniref:OmpA family protein n=1 Tax=Hypericibacter sp. TaxID=2705401 RepID=UPI003D6CAC92
MLALSLATAACSSSSDAPPPPAAAAPASTSTTSTGNESFPNLGTVPDQPPTVTTPEQRQAIVDGLIADRKNAVYSDTSLTGEPTSSVAPPAPPPITPEGGGTTLGPSTITPPADTDTGGAAGAASDASPDMPATPQTPVSSQPLPDAPPEPPAVGTTVPSSDGGVVKPQSNAAPLVPGALQYAELSGGEGGAESDADDFTPVSPRLTQVADSGQAATAGANAPRGLIPEGPFSYSQAKPRATTAASTGNGPVTVDLSVIGGAPQASAQPQLQPTQFQQAVSRPPLYVDLGALDGLSEPAAQTPPAVYQQAVYQQPTYQQPTYQQAVYQPGNTQWQPNANQLALYQVPSAAGVATVAPGAVPLPPADQPLGLIFFANGSSYLNAASREVLHDVARIYRAQGKTIRVVGHASWIPGGNNSFNSKLSYARSQAVAKALADYGVPGGALEMRGVGITQPVFYETASTGIAGNRRADIFLTP